MLHVLRRLNTRRACQASLRLLPRQQSTLPIPNDEHNRPALSIDIGACADALPDPYVLTQGQLRPPSESVAEFMGGDHPVLTRAAEHFFELAGKRFRPTVVLLASMATNGGAAADPRQLCLAEISEVIHAAGLLHDRVGDVPDSRQSTRTAQRIAANKVAVLAGKAHTIPSHPLAPADYRSADAGDFLLARAAVLLAQLEDCEVVELMSTAIEEIVAGGLMQARLCPTPLGPWVMHGLACIAPHASPRRPRIHPTPEAPSRPISATDSSCPLAPCRNAPCHPAPCPTPIPPTALPSRPAALPGARFPRGAAAT